MYLEAIKYRRVGLASKWVFMRALKRAKGSHPCAPHRDYRSNKCELNILPGERRARNGGGRVGAHFASLYVFARGAKESEMGLIARAALNARIASQRRGEPIKYTKGEWRFTIRSMRVLCARRIITILYMKCCSKHRSNMIKLNPYIHLQSDVRIWRIRRYIHIHDPHASIAHTRIPVISRAV